MYKKVSSSLQLPCPSILRRLGFSFGYDPVKCPCCGKKMLFLELYFEYKPVPLIEMYEKTIGKYRHFP
jgi:hypothetical protein